MGRGRQTSRRGSVLVLALVSVLVVSVLAAAFLQLSLAVTRRQGLASDTKRAFYVAEAGLAEAYCGLAMFKTGNVGTPDAPAAFGDGLFWVEASEAPSGLVELECTALCGSGRVTLGLVAEPVEIRLTALGFFAADSLQVNPSTLIDSFDSGLGSYADQVGTASNQQALLGSNGDIVLDSGDQVLGDVMAGPTGSVTLQSGASVSGTTGSRTAEQALPPIDVPAIPSQPGLTHSGAIPHILPPGSDAFDSITVAKDAKLIIQGPSTLVIGDLTVEQDGELCFDPSLGPVDCYITGSVDLKSDSLVSTSTTPSDTLIQVASPESESVDFGSTAQFYGFLYAPNAQVQMGAKFEVFGGVISKGMNLAAQGKLHYDLAGLGTRADRLPALHAWRVVDIPQDLAKTRIDPFVALGLDPALLSKAADAHEDQWLVLTYHDASGVVATYAGWESAFDWTDVRSVEFGTRDGNGFVFVETPRGTTTTTRPPPPVGYPGDWIGDPTVSTTDLPHWLVDASPLLAGELTAAIVRVPPLEPEGLKELLLVNSPLSNSDLTKTINQTPLSDVQLREVLIANSPLATPVKNALTGRIPPMNMADLLLVLAAQ